MARLCKACVDKNFVICVTMSSNGFTVFYTSCYTATLYLVFLYIYKYKEREKGIVASSQMRLLRLTVLLNIDKTHSIIKRIFKNSLT